MYGMCAQKKDNYKSFWFFLHVSSLIFNKFQCLKSQMEKEGEEKKSYSKFIVNYLDVDIIT